MGEDAEIPCFFFSHPDFQNKRTPMCNIGQARLWLAVQNASRFVRLCKQAHADVQHRSGKALACRTKRLAFCASV